MTSSSGPSPELPFPGASAAASTGVSCYWCQKENLQCDTSRPCASCRLSGRAGMCYGTEIASGSVDREPSPARKKKRTRSPSPFRPPSLEYRQETAPSNPSQDEASRLQGYGSTPTPQLNPLLPNLTRAYADAALQSNQLRINHYLIEELNSLKLEQIKVNQQLAHMQTINLELVRQLNALKDVVSSQAQLLQSQMASQPQFMTPYQPSPELEGAQYPMIVFDLMKSPAVVITANEKFLSLFGYSQKEVTGLEWRRFIHPDYIESTFNRLRQEKSAQLQFIQAYITKDNRVFFAQDNHTFFFGPNNVPVADFVIIKPLSAGQIPPQTSPSSPIPSPGRVRLASSSSSSTMSPGSPSQPSGPAPVISDLDPYLVDSMEGVTTFSSPSYPRAPVQLNSIDSTAPVSSHPNVETYDSPELDLFSEGLMPLTPVSYLEDDGVLGFDNLDLDDSNPDI